MPPAYKIIMLLEFIAAGAICGIMAGGIVTTYLHATSVRGEAGVFAFIDTGIRIERVARRLVRRSEDVNYAAVMKTTNGNGHPSFETPLYATLVASHVDEVHDSRHQQFERIQIDRPWRDTLTRMYQNQVQALYTDTMADGEMKDLYTREGLQYVELHILTQTATAGYYLAVGSYTQKHMDGARWDITNARNELRQALQNIFGK